MKPEAMPDPGSDHLRRVGRFQLALLPLGGLAWLLRSRDAALVFVLGGLTSLAFWSLHRLLVVRMLTPKVGHRWFYGVLTLGKLALMILVLRGIMERYASEGLPLVTGITLFVTAILLEAVRTAFSGSPDPTDEV